MQLISNADYYDIDDFLCESQLVPTTFLHDCIGLGYIIDNSGNTDDISIDTKCDIPYWLSHILSIREHTSISIGGKLYGDKLLLRYSTLDNIDYVDLYNKNNYYFMLAYKISNLSADNSHLINTIRTIFTNRYHISKQQDNNNNVITADNNNPCGLLYRNPLYSYDTKLTNHMYYNNLTIVERDIFDIKRYILTLYEQCIARQNSYNINNNVLIDITNNIQKQMSNKNIVRINSNKLSQTNDNNTNANKLNNSLSRANSMFAGNENVLNQRRVRA